MYRINYTNLNKKQVEDILAKRTPPVCTAEACGILSGKTMKIVLDSTPVAGPTLEYNFSSDKKLTLVENGAAAVECDYGALSHKNITLFSHMLPNTKKGYTVIVNWDTAVVTVFEMWFTDNEGKVIDTSKEFYDMGDIAKFGEFVNREVQRQYYFGYFEIAGKEPPATRDKLSLRLENCVIDWKDTRGRRQLTTYTSTTFSTHVELDTPDGGDVLSFVSDLFQMNENTFLFSYGEVEYSGRFGVEVIDLYSMKKIGVSLGIDENDEFEYKLYTGCGDYCGRYSAFFDFNDKGDKYSKFSSGALDFSVKGTRSTYRPSLMAKIITQEQLVESGKKALIFSEEKAAQKVMQSSHFMKGTDYCVGKKLKFRSDNGFVIEYEFTTDKELKYRIEGDSEWHTEKYRPTLLDDDLVILAHYCSTIERPTCIVLALDFSNGCATCIYSKMGTNYEVRDVDPDYYFGTIDMEGLKPLRIFRHGFTDELLGRAFTWTYSDLMTSIHMYNAPRSYSWTIITSGEPGSPAYRAGGPVWSSPCEYIKLRDDVYIVNWVEHKWEGLMGCAAMNLRIMHDCGFTFGVMHDGENIFLDEMGAASRSAGKVDLSGIYELKNYNTRA